MVIDSLIGDSAQGSAVELKMLRQISSKMGRLQKLCAKTAVLSDTERGCLRTPGKVLVLRQFLHCAKPYGRDRAALDSVTPPFRSSFGRIALALIFLSAAVPTVAAAATNSEVTDVTELPFEQLLNTRIITADKLARQVSDAASAVSIVTARDIKTYGYRTLHDILNSMRGLYMSKGPMYGFMGGRGFGEPGEYAGRITLLIDGYRAPDNYYGQSYFGDDGMLDVELIERVEYIPGSGSSSYGDSAFLGVINVITKKGESFDGVQLSKEFGSHNLRKTRLTAGQQFENGVDLLFSASNFSNDGRIIDDASTFGSGYDRFENETNHRYFLKAAYQGWSFESAWAKRPITYPYSNGQVLSDGNTFSSLRYDKKLSSELRASTHAYWGQYQYHIGADGNGLIDSMTTGRWWGIDSKLVGTWFNRHTLVFGAEYRNDYQQDYKDLYQYCDFDTGTYDPSGPIEEYRGHANRKTRSIYAYDDFALRDNLRLTLGGRQDSRNNGSQTFSPRGALIYTPTPGTILKLSAGVAHRQPTPNDESWTSDIPVERVQTRELVWEQQLGEKSRLVSSLYRSRIDRRQEWDGDGKLFAQGAEFELEHLWDNGVRLRTSYAWQNVHDGNGQLPENTPRLNAKLNLSAPLIGEQLRVGLATRYLGRRLDWDRNYEPGGIVNDLTLSGHWQNWSASFSIRNLFNAHFNDVGSYTTYPIDGRNYWLQLNYDFK